MDIINDDVILRELADGNTMDYEQWPDLMSRLLLRIEKIIRETFAIPAPQSRSLPSQTIPSSPPDIQTQPSIDPFSSMSTDSIQSTDKENAAPSTTEMQPDTLPPQLLSLLQSITSTLTIFFSKYPPHTIQRLAELILNPKERYRNLPAYLHALDRVVHVTSGANTFPLPPAVPNPASATIFLNGTRNESIDPLSVLWGTSTNTPSPAADESLGGALLTPIPWLINGTRGVSPALEDDVQIECTKTSEGSNGPGHVETVSISTYGISSTTDSNSGSSISPGEGNGADYPRAEEGVTQGELLRQEQQAGVVPTVQVEAKAGEDGMGEQDEHPHARGPEEIGMEDMGPQSGSTERLGLNVERHGPGVGMQGINVEAAVGRRAEGVEGDETDVTKTNAEEDNASERPGTPITPKRMADELITAQKRIKFDEDREIRTSDERETLHKEDEIRNEEDQDTNVQIVNADGRRKDERKVGQGGENVGVDVVDGTSQ